MTPEEILHKAIEKAVAGGWYGIYKDGHTWPEAKYLLTLQWDDQQELFHDGAIKDEYTINVEAIIYDHHFAKALWKDEKPFHYKDTDEIKEEAWQYHLQQMVIADDPIQYLGNNLPA